MQRLVLFIFPMLIYAAPGIAGVFEDCETAIESNDTDLAAKAAEIITFGRGIYVPLERADLIDACLALGSDDPYAYSFLEKRFVPPDLAESHNNRYQTQRALAKRREELQELTEQAKKLETERAEEVANRLIAGCTEMYRRDPDETITRQLCYDVFRVIGLPD